MAKKKKRTKKKSVKKRLIAPPPKKQKSSEARFLIAVLAILIILFFISSFYNRYKVKSEAEIILSKLVVGDEVNEQALSSFMNKDYNELKKELGITKNFLVYFEDEDEIIIPVNGRYCFGYEEVALNNCR